MKQKIERVTISGKVVAIRASIALERGGRYRKQFIVNEATNERDAILAAKEYIAMVIDRINSMPAEREIVQIVESIVDNAKRKDAHNSKLRSAVGKDVSSVLSRYPLSTTVFGYENSLGEWVK
jgi:hypothetical protein